MAGASLLTLIDDIATLLDDVAVMTKVAVKKTAGVLGDDLALNAQQVTGVRAERELPVVWAVAMGSLLNKVILVPMALLISAFAPWAVVPLLMLGGAFLCFEGFEKIAHRWLHTSDEEQQKHADHIKANANEDVDLVEFEKEKIKGAIRTDFILSAEIIVISLGTVASAAFGHQVAVLVGISLLMTVGVYGLVAGIVKLDDLGMWMARSRAASSQAIGNLIVSTAPWLMKTLSVVGTAAMFLVGGSIIAHGVPWLTHFIHPVEVAAVSPPFVKLWQWLMTAAADALLGVVVGGMVLATVSIVKLILTRCR